MTAMSKLDADSFELYLNMEMINVSDLCIEHYLLTLRLSN